APPTGATAPTSPSAPARGRRKQREGTVVSSAMEKTAVVAVIDRVRHPRYAKTVQRTKRLYAHDEQSDVKVGDRVRVQETRPLSRLKRWRIVEVLERAR
ncbi:MAG TPA: 30S ribosomal protein S17, partial [Egibacteraceae bacterium]|nr:30S ribosomal protein S17 [Egibacteraceae bacterium]